MKIPPPSDTDAPQYGQRDTLEQGNYFMRHMLAMTGESLHAKSAIAAELAHRDMEIDRLRKDAERYRWLRDRCPWTLTSAHAITRLALRLPVGYECHLVDVIEMESAIDAAMAKT